KPIFAHFMRRSVDYSSSGACFYSLVVYGNRPILRRQSGNLAVGGGGTVGADDSELDAHGHEDERDERDILANPHPARSAPDFPDPNARAVDAAAVDAVPQRVTVITRPLPSEGVPNCSLRIGTATATTNGSDNATINLSDLADGEYAAVFRAPDTSSDEMGPDFPPDPTKKRGWRSLDGRVRDEGGQIGAATAPPPDALVVSNNALRVALQPAWLKAPIASSRPGPVDMIVVHHTAGNLQGDLQTFLYANTVSIHYLVAPNGDLYKLVKEDRVAAHAGYSHWQRHDGMNGRSIGIEMTHISGEYPAAQLDAVVALVKKLKQAFPGVPAGRVIGHADIGICEPTAPNPCTPAAPKRLGRKSSDPGFTFPWERIEQLGLSLQIAPGTV